MFRKSRLTTQTTRHGSAQGWGGERKKGKGKGGGKKEEGGKRKKN